MSLEIQVLQALKVKRDKFSALKVPKVRKVNRVQRDLQETKVLMENKEIPVTQALLDQQDPQETRFAPSSVRICHGYSREETFNKYCKKNSTVK